MKKLLLDTNFFIDLYRFKVGLERLDEILEEQFECFILSSSIEELKKIAREKGKAGKFARLVLEIIKNKKVKVIEVEGKSTDEAFLSLADKNTIIATNDSKLRKKLKEMGVKTIYLRGRKRLEVG